MLESITLDLRNKEMDADVIYNFETKEYVLLINNIKIKLDEGKAYKLHNKFRTAVTQEVLYKIEKGEL